MDKGEYRLVNAEGKVFLFYDADSTPAQVEAFAYRFNEGRPEAKRFVYIESTEGIIEILMNGQAC